MDYNTCSNLHHFLVKEDKMDFTNNNLNRDIKPNHNSDSKNGMSKAELRKSNKPIMEKRRRARINHCLNELKSLILEAMKKDPARHSKLEKADILEMTVKHLQSIQRQQFNLAIQTDPTVVHKFKTGFTECAEEVSRFLGQLDGIDSGTRHRLIQHLNGCATRIEEIGTFSNFSSNYHQVLNNSGFNQTIFGATFDNASVSAATSSSIFNTTGKVAQDVDNNCHIKMNGVKLIPSRLPSGELALIMPNSTTLPSSLLMPKIKTKSLELTTAAATTTQFPRLSAFSKPTSTVSSMHLCTNAYISNQYQNLNSNSLCNNNIEHLQNNQKGNLKLDNLKCHHNQLFSPATICVNCNTTTVSSPPLSPVSSISSIGDDSAIHTSAASDYGTKTPPLEKLNTSDYFSTPPSSESVKLISRVGHLQQQHVSSTVDELIRNKNDFKKKLTPIADDCILDENPKQPYNKIIKLESDDEGNSSSKHFLDDSNDSMWRPW